MSALKRLLKVLLPIVVLAGASLTAYLMYLNQPPVLIVTPEIILPAVRVQEVVFETINLTVLSQGTVQPRTSSQLVPEISGTVTEVATSFAVGGFFEAGEVLLKIDPFDYQQALIEGRSQLAQSQLRLALEETEADVARREWKKLGRGDPNALTLREPQVAEARAAVAVAEAALDRAARDLERAEIKAPYAGRLQSKDVDIGQFVSKGTPVARIYAVDSAEIRLPLPDEELAFVDVPLSYRGGGARTGPRVTISANFAGRRHAWRGNIVRTEGEIDPVSRMVHVVAEVRDPYAPGSDTTRPPLAAGMYVEAEIEGRIEENVVVLPWAALRGQNQVMVVDADHRLQFRDIEILRSTSDEVLVRGGLSEGELVCISTLDVVTDGMAVRVVDDDTRMGNTTTNSATATTPLTPAVALTSVVPVAVTRPSPDTVVPTPVASGLEFEPALNREEQIAAIRRLMLGDPVLTGAPSAPTARVDKPAVSDEAAPSVAGSTKRVAVLPFANLSRNPADDWIGNGFTDALRSTLKVAAAMEVVALTAGDEATVLETAAARNVRWLVEGGYQRIGDKLRLTARVLEVSDGDLVDSIKLDSTLDDLDALTSSLVAAVRAGLGNVAVASPITAEPPPGRSGRLEDRVVAILPFTNISRDGEDDRIGTDLTEALARGLLRIDGVSILALEETDKADTIQADAARGVVRLITGGYQRVGNRVRITARLLDVASGTLIQTAKVDGTIEDLPGLLTEMVSTLRAALEERSARRVREWILFPIAGETA